MIPYSSLSGKQSGVTAFEIGDDYIKVRFTNFKTYKYSVMMNGRTVIDHMKSLALRQEGLSTFISISKPSFI